MIVNLNLQNDFNSLITRIEAHDKDYRELKAKQTGTNFAISYVTSRLLTGNAIIQETHRKWNNNEMNPAFFDFINFSLPCGADCPMSLAKPSKCSFADDRKTLFLDFNVPVINRTLKLLEADPFEMI